MEHTSQPHKSRRRASTRTKSSRPRSETKNIGRHRDRDVGSPSKTYRPTGLSTDRSDDRSSRGSRSPASRTGIHHPPRMHLPSYPPDITSGGMTTSMRREQLPKRRPAGSRRLSVDIRYVRPNEATVRQFTIEKSGNEGWLHAIGIPRIVTDGRRRSESGSQSDPDPEAAINHDRRRHVNTREADDTRGDRGEGNGSGRARGNHCQSELTEENLTRYTASEERNYERRLRQMQVQATVTAEAATTRRRRDPTSKRKSSAPRTSQLPVHRVPHSPDQTQGSPVAGDTQDRGRSRGTGGTRGTATETHPKDEAMTSLSKDSALAYYFNPSTPTSEPIDDEETRPSHQELRPSKKHSSRPKRTEPPGHRPSQRHGRKRSGSSHEKWKRTTRYRSPDPGCLCVVL